MLNDIERATLVRVADWFLPDLERYPRLADADPDGGVLELVLSQLAPLQEAIVAALADVPADGLDHYLTALESSDAEQFVLLRTVCLGWYLTCRPVWTALGYTGRTPTPISPGDAEGFLRDDVLAPVRMRGKIFRPT